MTRLLIPLLWASLLITARADAQGPAAPSLLEPADRAVLVAPHPEFRWSPGAATSPAAAEYHIEIAADESFTQGLLQGQVASVIHRFVPRRPLGPGRYGWRVRSVDAGGRAGPWSAPRTLDVQAPASRFTVKAGSDAAALDAVIARAAASAPAVVDFEPGRYVLSPAGAAAFSLRSCGGLILNGNGATLRMDNVQAMLARIDQCSDVTFRNFILDYPRWTIASTVVAVDAKARTFDIRVHPGSPAPYLKHLQGHVVGRHGFAFLLDPSHPGRIKPGGPGWLRMTPDVQDLGGEVFRLTLRPEWAGHVGKIQPGDLCAVMDYAAPIFRITRSSRIVFQDLTARINPGAFWSGDCNQSLAFLDCRAPLVPGCPVGGHSGMSPDDRTGAWIEGCSFESLPDDGPNLTALGMFVQDRAGPRALRMAPSFQAEQLRASDVLEFYDPVQGVRTGSASIVSAARVGRNVELALDADPGPIAPGDDMRLHTHAYCRTRAQNELVVRHCSFKGGRRFGLFIKARAALIEDNLFEDLASSAIHVENEPTGREGLASCDLVIRRNTILRCGIGGEQGRTNRSAIHLHLWAAGRAALPHWPGHENIRIEDNRIVDWEKNAITISSARNVLVARNRIASRDAKAFLFKDNVAIRVDNAQGVRLVDNVIEDTRPLDDRIRVTRSQDVSR